MEVVGGDDYFAVLRAEHVGHPAGLVQLGAAVVGAVADRERLHFALAALLAQVDELRGDAARVQPSGEEDAEGHVGHEPRLGGVPEPVPQLVPELAVAARVGRVGELALPVAPDLQLAVLVDGSGRRGQLVDAGEHRQRRRHVAGAQIEIERLVVQLAGHARVAEQRLDLGPEDEALPPEVVVERLLSQPVAGDEEPLPARVPDGEREHSRQPLRQRVAPLLVSMDQHFGVAARPEDVPFRDQLLAQRQVVVDLAVEGDGDGAVLVVHRLRAVLREIDDREAAVSEGHRPGAEVAAAVGTAVRDDVGHPTQQRLIRGTILVAVYEAADAAHAVTP